MNNDQRNELVCEDQTTYCSRCRLCSGIGTFFQGGIVKKALFVLIWFVFLSTQQAVYGGDYEEIKTIADDYLDLYKKGNPIEAFKKYWSWDIFAGRAFGENYALLSKSEKEKVRGLLFDIATGIFLNQDVVRGMRESEFVNRRIEVDRNGVVKFYFEMTFLDGDRGEQSILLFQKSGNKFRCVDLSYNNDLLSNQISSDFNSVRDQVSLPSYLRNMKDQMADIKKAWSATWLHGTWELAYDPDNGEKDWLIFSKTGMFKVKDSGGIQVSGPYILNADKVKLIFRVKERTRELELTISKDKSRISNSSGAYYTKVQR